MWEILRDHRDMVWKNLLGEIRVVCTRRVEEARSRIEAHELEPVEVDHPHSSRLTKARSLSGGGQHPRQWDGAIRIGVSSAWFCVGQRKCVIKESEHHVLQKGLR